MKIEISELESYEVKMPEVITREQFIGVMDRLNRILKIVNADVFASSKDVIVSEDGNEKAVRHYKHHKRTKLDREKAIELLKVHYSEGTGAEKLAKMKQIAPFLSDSSFKSRLYQLRKVFKIDAKEIGLTKFPGRLDGAAGNLDKFRIKQNGNEK